MGRLFLDGTEFCAEDWSIQETANEEDTTSTCDAGNMTQEFGPGRLEGTINATWDASDNPYDRTPQLKVGNKYPNTKLYVNASPGVGAANGPFFGLTLQVASGVETSVPVKGKVTVTIPFLSHGAYNLPVGDSSGA